MANLPLGISTFLAYQCRSHCRQGIFMRTDRTDVFFESPACDAEPWSTGDASKPQAFTSRWLAETREACGAFEWITFGYLGWLLAVFVICRRNIAHPNLHFALHLTAAIAILALARAAARSDNAVVQFVRHWYPLPLYLWLFEELTGIVHAFFPVWFDRFFIEFDYNLAGVHPSVWLARYANPALNDFMQFAYLTYFLYLVILPAILYFNRERLAFWTVMACTAIGNYSIYVIALLIPVESPFHALAALQTKELTGGPVTAVINLIERFGRVHGAAFPSAHVAGSMVAILASWRCRRWLFWICLPFFISMCVATVYGRYHYVADVLAGLVVGTVGFLAGSHLMRHRGALPRIAGADTSG